MCGRGAATLSAERCSRVAGGARVRHVSRLRPRYNLGPQGYVPVVTGGPVCADRSAATDNDGKPLAAAPAPREVQAMRWGLVPSFAKRQEDYDVFKGGSSTFNARVESVESSGLWRRLVDSRRCVVLFDGFYEWKAVGKGKVPMFIRNPDSYQGHTIAPAEGASCAPQEQGASEPVLPVQATPTSQAGAVGGPSHAPLMMAGLYDTWRSGKEATASAEGDDEGMLESVTILTMESDGTPIAAIHDRTPVFLTPETAATWLDRSASFAKVIRPVLHSAQVHAKQLLIYEVSPLVSNVKNESPDCILSKKEYDARQFSRGLGKFFTKKASSPADPSAKPAQESPPQKRPLEQQKQDDGAPPAKSLRADTAKPCSATASALAEAAVVIDLD